MLNLENKEWNGTILARTVEKMTSLISESENH